MPATTKLVFFDTLPATFAPSASSFCFASSRLSAASVPVSTTLWPSSGPAVAALRSASLSTLCSATTQRLNSARASPSASCASRLSATSCGTSVAAHCFGVAFASASSDPNAASICSLRLSVTLGISMFASTISGLSAACSFAMGACVSPIRTPPASSASITCWLPSCMKK